MIAMFKFSLIAIGFGVLFQALGFSCPGWLIMKMGPANCNMALWYVIVCTEMPSYGYGAAKRSNCFTFSYHHLFQMADQFESESNTGIIQFGSGMDIDSAMSRLRDIGYQQLVQMEVMATFALLLSILAFVSTRSVYKRYQESMETRPVFARKTSIFAFLASLVSGILIFVPVGNVAQAISTLKEMLDIFGSSSFDGVSLGIPYGLIFAGLGGGLTLVAALFLLFNLTRRSTQGQTLSTPAQQTVPLVQIPDDSNPTGYDPRFAPPPEKGIGAPPDAAPHVIVQQQNPPPQQYPPLQQDPPSQQYDAPAPAPPSYFDIQNKQ